MAQTMPPAHHARPLQPILSPTEWIEPVTVGPNARAKAGSGRRDSIDRAKHRLGGSCIGEEYGVRGKSDDVKGDLDE